MWNKKIFRWNLNHSSLWQLVWSNYIIPSVIFVAAYFCYDFTESCRSFVPSWPCAKSRGCEKLIRSQVLYKKKKKKKKGGGVLCSIPAVPQPFYPLYCCSTLAQHGTCMYHSGYGNKQPFKATALRQAPQHADIWPSCFGHWPSSVDLDTYLAISQWKWLAAPSPGLPSSCKHSTWRRHGDRSGVDGNSLPLAFCLMNSMPSFCGRRATHQTFLFPAKRAMMDLI